MPDITWKTTGQLPDAILGVPYNAGLAINGAATSVTAGAVASGALPAGIAVDATDKVRLSGTPTAAGNFTFTITLTDTAGGVTSGTLTLRVRDFNEATDKGSLTATQATAAAVTKLRWP